MQRSDGEMAALTPEESWEAIHETVDRVRSSMYVAGTAMILLLWGALVSLGFLSQYGILTLAPEFVESSPWISGLLWGVLCAAGMVGSVVIGHRAGRENAVGDVARSAGIRMFLFWLAVVAAAFLVPASGGNVELEGEGANIPRVAVGIVALGSHPVRYNAPPGDRCGGRGIRCGVLHPQLLCGGCRAGSHGGSYAGSGRAGLGMDTQERRPVTDDETIILNETIHQSTRLRIMTMLVSRSPREDRVAYGSIQKTLGLTGGNLTTHLRKLEEADYLVVMKESQDSRPRTWVWATATGRRAYGEYLSNLERVLKLSRR